MKTTKLAKELPQHKSFPRYVKTGQAVTDCDCGDYQSGFGVRLSTRCWISSKRWNELAQQCSTFDEQFQTAMKEARANREAGKAAYAQLMNAAARTGLEMDAAANGMTLAEYLPTLVK